MPARTCCATVAPPTWARTAPTFARYRRSLDTPTFRPRRFIRTRSEAHTPLLISPCQPAHAAPQSPHPHGRERLRPSHGPDDPWTRRHFDHADLYAPRARPAE